MSEKSENNERLSEFDFDIEFAQKINDYIFLDSKRYDGYAGDDI